MEQNFQDVSQKAMHDNNMEYFADHFSKNNYKKLIPQQCYDIMSYKKHFYSKFY